MRARGLDEAGSAAAIGLIVALVIFSATFYYLTTTVEFAPRSTLQYADERNYDVVAENLGRTLISSGEGWYSGNECTAEGVANTTALAPEQFGTLPTARFGLGEELCGKYGATAYGFNNVSFAKLSNIYEAQTAADPDNERVDYEEARASLGLDDEVLDFHLRTWLIPSSVNEIIATGFKDRYLRPVYVGHYVGEANPPVPHVAGVVNNADNIVLYVYLTNNGAESTIFGVDYQLPLDHGNMQFTLHSPLLEMGQSYNVTVTIRKTNDWTWAGEAQAHYIISDPYENLESGTIDLSGVSMSYTSARNTQVVWTDSHYYTLDGGSASAVTHYTSWNGKGRSQTFNDWTQIIYGPPLGLPVVTNVLPNTASGLLTSSLSATGTFTAKLHNDVLLSVWNQDVINVVPSAPDAFQGGEAGYNPSSSVAVEANFISTLVENFDPYAYSETYNDVLLPYAAGGDVYPDRRFSLETDFIQLLTDASGLPSIVDVSTIVIGSDVDHNAVRSLADREALADWVNAGGTLIVLGSGAQALKWLEGAFYGSFDAVTGEVTAVDGAHPLLNIPNDLDYVAYNQEVQVHYAIDEDLKFYTVISDGNSEDHLAVSNNGAFGSGRIILTSWRPHALTDDQATTCALPFTFSTNCQGLNLLHNLLTLSYRELFIDYGPMPSGSTSTGVSFRIVSVYHPGLRETVSMGLQVIVFAKGS